MTGCSTHNYTTTAGDTISLTAGTGASMSVATQGFDMACAVYMDLNSNGNFNTSGEMLFTQNYNFTSNLYFQFHHHSAFGYAYRFYRMRIISSWLQQPTALMGCGTFSYWGAWEDYTVYVVGTTCTPNITLQPLNATRCPAQSDTFVINANGSSLSYQWAFNGTAIPNDTLSSLLITNIDSTMAGNYTCTLLTLPVQAAVQFLTPVC